MLTTYLTKVKVVDEKCGVDLLPGSLGIAQCDSRETQPHRSPHGRSVPQLLEEAGNFAVSVVSFVRSKVTGEGRG